MPRSGSRRKKANQRFQQRVLALAEQLLPQLTELLEGDEDDRATASGELDRLSRSAEAVGLTQLAQTAAALVDWTGPAAAAIAQLAAHLGERPRTRFAAIHVLAGGRMTTLLRRQASWTAEPLVLSSDLEGLHAALAPSRPAAIVLPHQHLADMQSLTHHGAPIFIYGPPDDWTLQGDVVQQGAAGFLPDGFSLPALLRRVRAVLDQQATGTPQVFVLGDEGPQRAALAQALKSHQVSTVASDVPTAVIPALEQVVPHAIVILSPVQGRDAHPALALARSHGRGTMPCVVAGTGDAGHWLDTGADVFLPSDTPADLLARHVLAQCRLHIRRASEHDPVSGLPMRAATLGRLDDLVAHAHRRLEPLAVGIVEIRELAALAARWQRSGVVQVREAVATTILQTVRRVDLVGCLGPDAFLIAMRGVHSDLMHRRLQDIARRFARVARGAHHLREARLGLGTADTEFTTDDLALRAQADLEANTTP